MGGEVIAGILGRSKKFAFREGVSFIMQPTTSPEALRRFLCENGFRILKEIPISENSKVYSVISCIFTGEISDAGEGFYYVGLVKPDCDDGVLYIEKQKKRLLECIKALENIHEKKESYLYYKRAYEEIIAYSEN